MHLVIALISASLFSATREMVKVDGKSRITEVRKFDEHGHEEVEWTKSETRIDLLNDMDPKSPSGTMFLLKQEFWMRWNNVSEGSTSKLTLSRWNRTVRGYDSLVWTKFVAGHDVSFYEGMLQATLYGCCAEENTFRYLNSESGRLLATLSARPLEVNDAGSSLFLGYLPNHPKNFDRSDTTNRGGTLTLFSPDSVVSQLVVVPAHRPDASPRIRDLGDKFRLDYIDGDTLYVQVDKSNKLRLLSSTSRPKHP